jgi:hypothetical protein
MQTLTLGYAADDTTLRGYPGAYHPQSDRCPWAAMKALFDETLGK